MPDPHDDDDTTPTGRVALWTIIADLILIVAVMVWLWVAE